MCPLPHPTTRTAPQARGVDVLHPITVCSLIHPVYPSCGGSNPLQRALQRSGGFSRRKARAGPGSPGSPAGWLHSCDPGSRPGSGFPCRAGAGRAPGPVCRSTRPSGWRGGCAGAGSGAAPGWPPRIPAAGEKSGKRGLLGGGCAPPGPNPGRAQPLLKRWSSSHKEGSPPSVHSRGTWVLSHRCGVALGDP